MEPAGEGADGDADAIRSDAAAHVRIKQLWHANGSVTVEIGHAVLEVDHAELCFPACGDDALERMSAGADRTHAGAAFVHLDTPRRWWPAGYGDAPLYEVRAVLKKGVARPSVVASKRIGLRSVELVQTAGQPPSPGLPAGTNFFFRVNGVDIFARGANMIPASVFEDQVTDADLEWLLRRALDANMNMIRVWGGGRFQRDRFYEMADEMGLLLWQEMIFACAMYPTNAEFLNSVKQEVSEQVARLAHHPSIVIWGGNNENEGAIEWYAASKEHRDRYVADYMALYVDTIHPALVKADPEQRAWVDSSPSNGLLSTSPYEKRWGTVDIRAPNSTAGAYGDVHYYNYDADCEDPSTYPKTRFISEHGFQSFPSFRAYRKVSQPDDWRRNSPLLLYRQRHQYGNEQVEKMIKMHYRVPPENASSPSGQQKVFDDYLYLTQLQQARCYETAFTTWRRMRSEPAKTMGILYWQLNDVWQGPTWATIEYDGSPKLAHYATKRAFAPLLLSSTLDRGKMALNVHLSSESQAAVAGTLTLEIIPFAAAPATAAAKVTKAVTVPPLSSTMLWTVGLAPLLAKAKTDPTHSIARLTFTPKVGGARHLSVTNQTLQTFAWLSQPKDAELPAISAPVHVSASMTSQPNRAVVTISTDVTLAFVAAESMNVIGAFDDGAFMLLAGETKHLTFVSREPKLDLGELQKGLRVRSLRDTY